MGLAPVFTSNYDLYPSIFTCRYTISVVSILESVTFEEKITRVFSAEIQRIVDEIMWIDKRLALMGDDEESRAEKILLKALRKHLVEDLRALGGFTGDPYLYIGHSNLNNTAKEYNLAET